MSLVQIGHFLLIAIIVVCIVIDWRTTKIPNVITFPAAACGIIFNFFISDWHGVLMACLGWLIGAVLTVFLGNLPIKAGAGGGIGMGDAKLLAAIGAFLGPKSALITVFYFCLFFGLMSIFVLAIKVPWKQVGELVAAAIFEGDISEVKLDTTKLIAQSKSPIPISLAILFATLMTMFYRAETLRFFGLS